MTKDCCVEFHPGTNLSRTKIRRMVERRHCGRPPRCSLWTEVKLASHFTSNPRSEQLGSADLRLPDWAAWLGGDTNTCRGGSEAGAPCRAG